MKTALVYFCKFISSPFLESFFIEKVEGRENIPKNNGFILAPNHINGKDHWFIASILKEKLKDMRFVGALDSFKTMLLSGLLYYFSNAITINRKKVDRKYILGKIIENLKQKKIIVLYPEGDSNDRKILLKGKTGIADLALATGAPVVPVGMQSSKTSYKRIIKIGKPLYYSKQEIENKPENYNQVLRKITDQIMREISRLSQKPYNYDN
ncbi:MAG: 1-acyl-sn-glycerol-3-phosphate acyltransferase [Patescibacteria group bacterium]|nr:1-acyl-sn-glycerol-3-phosphate acyltransferase [Patescibacteria group bacterium]